MSLPTFIHSGLDCLESLVINGITIFWHSVWEEKTVSLIIFVEFQPIYKLNIVNI